MNCSRNLKVIFKQFSEDNVTEIPEGIIEGFYKRITTRIYEGIFKRTGGKEYMKLFPKILPKKF